MLILQKVKEVGLLMSYRTEYMYIGLIMSYRIEYNHPTTRCCCQPLQLLFIQKCFPPSPCPWPGQQVLVGAQGINLEPGNPQRSQNELGGKRPLRS